jgi:anti-sigma regulatory factor (Ser/Thr protein kinase)
MGIGRVAEADLIHGVLAYRDSVEFAAAAWQFARAGTAVGQPVLIAASGANLDRLRASLDGQTNAVTLANIATSANPRRVLGMIRDFAAAHPGQPVRCVQQLAWYPRPAAELREAEQMEGLVGAAQAAAPVSMLCGYERRLGAAVLGRAQRAHRWLVQDGRWQENASFAGWHQPGSPLPDPPSSARSLIYRDNQSQVRDVTATDARAAGLPPDRVTDLVIAVAELAANTLCHARGTGTLSTWSSGDEFVVQVHDNGQIADPLAGTLRPAPASDRRGRGLWVVNQLCDLVEVRSGPDGTTVRLHMLLPR